MSQSRIPSRRDRWGRAGRRVVGVVPVLSLLTLGVGTMAAADPVEFNRDIRPILSENCFLCHGPDSGTRKANLRLDRREVAVELGAIVPGDTEASELLYRINADDELERMPPRESHKTLTARQKDLLTRWIAEGAEYQPLWSFLAPKRPTPPTVKNEAWVRNPIDRFVLAKLEAAGLTPAPEADRRTLARRLSLDLTGLPPDPAVVEAFVQDTEPDAYERLVAKFLGMPQWGEHRARFWLDAARYADTHGIHFDNFREMWTYRDWVIGAFNRNVPFDQFTIEQLAGDLLPNRTLDQQVASGFNRCNITTNEGGVIPEEYLVLYDRDRTETVSQVWLGLTMGCAVCHDHKFDPISQKEFYEMGAFFNNTIQGAMDGNVKDTPPITFVPNAVDRDRWGRLDGELAGVKQKIDARKRDARPDFDAWLANVASSTAPVATVPTEGLRLHAPLSEGDGTTLDLTVDGKSRAVVLPEGLAWQPGHVAAQALKTQPKAVVEVADAGDFEKDQGFSYGAWIQLPKADATGAVVARMDDQHEHRGWDLWIEGGKVGAHIIHKWPDDAMKVVSTAALKPGEWSHVLVTYDGSAKASGVTVYVNGRPQATSTASDTLKSTIRAEVPLKLAQRQSTSRLDGLLVQDLRVYGRTLPAAEVAQLAGGSRAAWLAAKPADKRTEAETNELFNWWLTTIDASSRDLVTELAALEREQAAIKARGTIAHVMQEKPETPTAFILFRGEYDKRRDAVHPDTPDVLPPMPPELPKDRLGLAQWLLRPEHPLTARVTVNRFWQEVFGTALVRTTGDFGVTGEQPSHPELLDWMAVEFRESGWDVKEFFTLLVTSATYRQAAVTTPETLEKDPQNRLLSRGPRFRMDAEMVRDYALAAGDLLVRKLGGPSVKPYQPDGVWEAVAMIGSNTRDYKRDSGENLYRRSLYTFWKRSAPPASMDIFNAPSREVCTVRRERTNTPLQALVTLNDPQFVEAARHLAQLALKQGGAAPEVRFDFLARRLLARPLRAEEVPVVRASLDDLLAYYQSHPEQATQLIAVGESQADPALDAPTLAAWTMLTNELMNLDEVLNK
ncbi:MAG TPA: DUF1553 domain-containing protein [Isosphaeraceae bacterium]